MHIKVLLLSLIRYILTKKKYIYMLSSSDKLNEENLWIFHL